MQMQESLILALAIASALSNMTPKDNKVPRNLKFKVTSKGIRDGSEDNFCGSIRQNIVNNGGRDKVTGGGSKGSEVNVLVKAPMEVNFGKRRPEMCLDGRRGKKPKIDCNLKLQLSNILKGLMNHPVGRVFSEPVDPVKFGIPDYFSIITKPMDLGTIKHKLERNVYLVATEFVADVELTFSNAMLYNPPGNEVHHWAKILAAEFSRKWRLLKAKLKHGKKNGKEAGFIDCIRNNGQNANLIVDSNNQNMKPIGINNVPLPVKLGTSRSISLEDKRKFRLELVQLLSKKMIERLQPLFQKFGLTLSDKERLDSFIDSTDDETLWKLRKEIKAFLVAGDRKVTPGKIALKRRSSPNKTVEKEHCSRSALASASSTYHRCSIDSTEAGSFSCATLKCQCLRNDAVQGSASDITSERSAEHNHFGDSKPECEVRYCSASRMNSCGLDSDGPGVVDEANSPHPSTPATTLTSDEGWTFDVRMSPKKALRAAMLKRRFADTIFRATHRALSDHGENSNPSRMQQERERLEREQLEEKARIEAQVKAAEAASRRREQDNLRMQRERVRKAAWTALQNMEKTVEADDYKGILKDLEMMGCGFLFYLHEGIHHGSPLEQLGLHIKDEFLEVDEDAKLNGGNGEILL